MDDKPRTGTVNGRLWGARARDWADIQEGQCRALYEAVLDRTKVGKGTLYLDVGCGAGMALQIASARGATVAGLDASEHLLAIARERSKAARIEQGDIEELPFESGSFDVVTGFNSFQYAANPTRALGEARRVAKPGSPVVIVTWGDPKSMDAASIVAALKPLLPAPPPGAPGPFALSEGNALRDLASSAGLTPVETNDVICTWQWPDEKTAVRALGSSGVAVRAIENAGDDAVNKAHADALAPFRQPDGGYRLRAAFRYLLATA